MTRLNLILSFLRAVNKLFLFCDFFFRLFLSSFDSTHQTEVVLDPSGKTKNALYIHKVTHKTSPRLDFLEFNSEARAATKRIDYR